MIARTVLRLTLLSLAFGLLAMTLGWWSAAALGLGWGLMGTRYPVREAGAAALLGWLGVLSLTTGPELARLIRILGRMAPLPGAAYPAFAVIIGGLLAALGAAVTSRPRADHSFHHETDRAGAP